MKNLLIAVFMVAAVVFGSAYAEKIEQQPGRVIGHFIASPETAAIYKNLKVITVTPVSIKSGLHMFAESGAICAIFGHSYDGHSNICKFCKHERVTT